MQPKAIWTWHPSPHTCDLLTPLLPVVCYSAPLPFCALHRSVADEYLESLRPLSVSVADEQLESSKPYLNSAALSSSIPSESSALLPLAHSDEYTAHLQGTSIISSEESLETTTQSSEPGQKQGLIEDAKGV